MESYKISSLHQRFYKCYHVGIKKKRNTIIKIAVIVPAYNAEESLVPGKQTAIL